MCRLNSTVAGLLSSNQLIGFCFRKRVSSAFWENTCRHKILELLKSYDVFFECFNISIKEYVSRRVVRPDIGIKITIGAFRDAKWPMDIDSKFVWGLVYFWKHAHSNFLNAIERWLIPCFSSGSISPKLCAYPSGKNIGSYPNPLSPRDGQISSPGTVSYTHLTLPTNREV